MMIRRFVNDRPDPGFTIIGLKIDVLKERKTRVGRIKVRVEFLGPRPSDGREVLHEETKEVNRL